MLLTQNWAQKPSVLVQVLTARGRGGKISFFRAVKNGREKTPKPLRLRGFPVRYLFWSHNVVAGTGFEPATSGLWARRATSCSTPRNLGAGDRGRTGTGSLPRDFKSQASANSATPALFRSPLEAYLAYHAIVKMSIVFWGVANIFSVS